MWYSFLLVIFLFLIHFLWKKPVWWPKICGIKRVVWRRCYIRYAIISEYWDNETMKLQYSFSLGSCFFKNIWRVDIIFRATSKKLCFKILFPKFVSRNGHGWYLKWGFLESIRSNNFSQSREGSFDNSYCYSFPSSMDNSKNLITIWKSDSSAISHFYTKCYRRCIFTVGK